MRLFDAFKNSKNRAKIINQNFCIKPQFKFIYTDLALLNDALKDLIKKSFSTFR